MLSWFTPSAHRLNPVWLAALTFLLVGFQSTEVRSEESYNPFEVRDIEVDITADTASAARDQALTEAERKAFQVLLDRLTLSSDRVTVHQFRPGEIASATQHFWVSEEKVSPVRYLATLNYRFFGERVEELLAAKRVPFVTAVSAPVLIVPVYEDETGARLWDVPNPWWDAWARVRGDGLVPVMLPRGDANDFSVLDTETAMARDDRSLAALAARYGTSDAAVFLAALSQSASPTSSQTGAYRVIVVNKQALGLPFGVSISSSYVGDPDEPLEEVLSRAAAATLTDIEREWKTANVRAVSTADVMAVDVTVSNLGSWLALKKRLESLPFVHKVDTVMFSPNRVRVNLFYSGSGHELEAQLRRAGFFVTPTADALSISRSDYGGRDLKFARG